MASFRFHLAMNTLAVGYVIPAIRAYSGLAPIRQCSCRAYYEKKDNFITKSSFWVSRKSVGIGVYLCNAEKEELFISYPS